MLEIERKFLVNQTTYRDHALKSTRIVQGYLNSDPNRTVRIRIKGKQGFITIKGKSNKTGTSRFEWEKEIPIVEAEALIQLCETGVIEKTRYEIPSGKHIIEVDEFFGDNQGLCVAEIELTDENEKFLTPDWLGKEVTGDARYYNAQLSKKPFNTW